MEKSSFWNQQLVEKYNISGPRYTSYPTALEFSDNFCASNFQQALADSEHDKPVSLYLHIPFCKNICYYCACNKVITKDTSKATRYIEALIKEARLTTEQYPNKPKVSQLHWGGGTPTFLSNEQIEYLFNSLQEYFEFDHHNGEFSIEIDPRTIDLKTIPALQKIGFNRLSIGVQDFNPAVQKAVNRVQPEDEIRKVILQARVHGFESISVDLIYGLPHQTVESFNQTIDKIITMAPDRLSIFNYAHLPHRFKPQRRINATDLPSAEQKLAIMRNASERLINAGYLYIGMDHFALPHDDLSQAQREGKLHRNFQGYTTQPDCDLIALGVSSISQVNNVYSQNVRELDEYYQQIDSDQLAVWRGVASSQDDIIRRNLIMQLICHFEVDLSAIGRAYDFDYKDYFSLELAALPNFQEDKLLTVEQGKVTVSEQGRLFIRNICMLFDKNLQEFAPIQSYSKVI